MFMGLNFMQNVPKSNSRLQSVVHTFELTKASAKFEVATSSRDAFTRKYII